MIEFRLLGTLHLTDAEGREVTSLLTRPRRLALLAYLAAATPKGFHRRDTLLGLFWPELDQEHARAALRQALHVVRGALGAEAVLTRGDEEVGLDFDQLWCDVAAFDLAVAAYEEFAKQLGVDLEAEPAAETKALLAAVRARETAAPVELPGPASGRASAAVVAVPASGRRRVLWPALVGAGLVSLLLAAD